MFLRRALRLPAQAVLEQRIGVHRKVQAVFQLVGVHTRAHVADLFGIAAGIGVGAPVQRHALLHRRDHAGDVFGAREQRDITCAVRDLLRRAIHQPLRRVAADRRVEHAFGLRAEATGQRQRRIAEHALLQTSLLARRVRREAHHRNGIERPRDLAARAGVIESQLGHLLHHRNGRKALRHPAFARRALGELCATDENGCAGIECAHASDSGRTHAETQSRRDF